MSVISKRSYSNSYKQIDSKCPSCGAEFDTEVDLCGIRFGRGVEFGTFLRKCYSCKFKFSVLYKFLTKTEYIIKKIW